MKNTLKIFAILFLLINYSCKAQHMVQTIKDVHLLKNNEQQFINKPLKNLLKEIKPEIKNVLGTKDDPSYFAFNFISRDEIKRKVIGRKHINLYVYVKEPLKWNFNERPQGKEYLWSKEDVEKYGDLTVIRIKVIERIED
ncbi:hypothetical protein E0I61_01970 [Flavobacterium ranwuense]|uniref:Lipoprotein n=1 Tax=Flavobacterium ranwuense TaxID=2541725 RepID=A0ABY2DX36_9FLAO|nr:hypothetical protein [Flavobacterium ranwuense]TDE31487.1 hypothetical protein E0I61_01970 [Flavobacterium ranwuense]